MATDLAGLALPAGSRVRGVDVTLAEWHVGDAETARWGSSVFFALALLLQGFALFVFMASDVLLFYIAFEATLIPTYFLIAGYGGPKRRAAAIKFLIYSLAGGLVMLVAVAGLYAVTAAQGGPIWTSSAKTYKEILISRKRRPRDPTSRGDAAKPERPMRIA